MKIINVKQGTEEWLRARAGIPTASEFHRIITPTGKPSAQAHAYMCQLIAERIVGIGASGMDPTQWMQRGSDIEREAVAWFEMETGLTTTEVGFVTTDDGRWGCSPDRLVGDDGLLEVKCPSAAVHVNYLLGGGMGDHHVQTDGQQLVTGRRRLWFMSYCPGFPPHLFEQLGTDYADLRAALEKFSENLDTYHAAIAAQATVKA